MRIGKKEKEASREIGKPGLIVQNNPRSLIAEQFRTVRTNVQFSMVDDQLKTIVVTSSAPSSGKSVISANISAAFAQDEKRVLLIDADLRKPTVHKTFGMRNEEGLTNVLTQTDIHIENVIKNTPQSGLHVLTSGPLPPNPAELLSSQRMKDILDLFKKHYDLIVFDMPPILAVTDAQIMASTVDGVIFIVPQGEVERDEVQKAASLLENVDANVLGFILNKVDASSSSYYYYDY